MRLDREMGQHPTQHRYVEGKTVCCIHIILSENAASRSVCESRGNVSGTLWVSFWLDAAPVANALVESIRMDSTASVEALCELWLSQDRVSRIRLLSLPERSPLTFYAILRTKRRGGKYWHCKPTIIMKSSLHVSASALHLAPLVSV